MRRKTWLIPAGIALAALAVLGLALAGNGTALRKQAYALAMPLDYFSAYDDIEPQLYQVAGPVYAFEQGFTRSLILRTNDGIAVFDSFSDSHAEALRAALARRFPGERIRWVIFSHNHLDHIRGSAALQADEVIGHRDVDMLVSDWPDAGRGIARVTRPIEGDQVLTLGGVEVRALYMPFSHSHTLYGFYLPQQGVVYAPDMMFVRMVPPFDFPDYYYPGYVRALDRLVALDAQHYVPSHGRRGSRDDLVAYRDMTVEFQQTVRSEMLARGIESATDGAVMREILKASYDRLEPRYGDWHGFDAMFVPRFGRQVGGTYLGY